MNPPLPHAAPPALMTAEHSELAVLEHHDLTVVIDSTPRAKGPWHRRITWVVAVIVVASAAAVATWLLGHHRAAQRSGTLTVTQVSGSTQITLTNGALDLSQLRSALVNGGHGQLVAPTAGGAYELTTNLVVGRGGRLTISRTALLLLSDAATHVRMSAGPGGWISFRQDTITSWTDTGAVDSDVSDGRADIVADGAGATMNFANSVVSFLGANADDPGVSWRDGAVGTIDATSFTNDYRGAYAYRSGELTVTNSTFDTNAEDGFYVLYPGAGTTIEASHFDNNISNGLEVDQASGPKLDDVEASGNGGVGLTLDNGAGPWISHALLHDNKQQGVNLTGPTAVRITASKIWANSAGIAISGGDATVAGTDLSGNVSDGVFVTGPTTKLGLTDDRLDHNDRSGLYVSDGSATTTGSVFDSNGTGADVAGPTAGLTASSNTIESSIKDGVALTGTAHVSIAGNVIENSGDAAISLAAKADIQSMLSSNTVTKGQTATRVRAS